MSKRFGRIKRKLIVVGATVALLTPVTFVGTAWACPQGSHPSQPSGDCYNDKTGKLVSPNKSSSKGSLGDPFAKHDCNGSKSCEGIFTKYLIPAINLLSAAVGIIVVAMIIYGGIEFSSSGGDPQRVASAKNHITNAIIALVAFLFLWAFLNFIIPGGVFNVGA